MTVDIAKGMKLFTASLAGNISDILEADEEFQKWGNIEARAYVRQLYAIAHKQTVPYPTLQCYVEL